MVRERRALDGARRRRMYLFRHGAVDYMQPDGTWVADPDVVVLSDKGHEQAHAMAKQFEGVIVDRAVCSGLPRTRQTGEIILGDRDIELDVLADLEEIRPLRGEATGGYDVFADIAYLHWRATDFETRFLGGEMYSDFYARIVAAMESLLANLTWNNLAVFAHGGTNAAALGWVLGLGLDAFGALDQENCCLNVIDFDTLEDDGRIVRKTVRGMNITAVDPLKRDRHAGDMEMLAGLLLKIRDGAQE